MYKIIPTAMMSVALLLAACNNKTTDNSTQVSPTTTSSDTTGVEQNDPNTDYTPAFAGQTRGPAVKTQTAFQGKLLTKDLNKPWGLVSLPDGRLLITEKEGTM